MSFSIEDAGDVVEQVEIVRTEIPTGVEQDTVLTVQIDEGEVAGAEPNPEETQKRQENAQERFDRLAGKSSRESDLD